jgi:sugar O-acyltransferase (sialic acid O-acetyltransferase NeuD family)
MVKNIIIYGIGDLVQQLLQDFYGNQSFKIACFTADSDFIHSKTYSGKPLIPFQDICRNYPPDDFEMLVIAGYTSMNNRMEMYNKAKDKGYTMVNYIAPTARIYPNLDMGENNIIMGMNYLGPFGKLGNNNIIRPGCYIGHHFSIVDHNFIAPGCTIGGYSTIEESCYIGIGTTIIHRKTIAKKTLIGAGALILKDTKSHSKYLGHPAKYISPIKDNDIQIQ